MPYIEDCSFLDADVTVPRDFIDQVCTFVGYRRAWLPICKDLAIPRQGCDRDGWRVHGYGLLGVTKRDFWWAGGWDEWECWGGEDDVMRAKLEINSCKLLRGRLVGLNHQDHPFLGSEDDKSRYERQQRIRDTVTAFRDLSSRSAINPSDPF